MSYTWSDASALYQLEMGSDTARVASAREYLKARLEGYTQAEINEMEDDD
jgi:hypothetical protein